MKALEVQALEAHKGLRKIIGLWQLGMKDPDRSIRFLTLAASIIGFVLLFIVAFASLHTGAAIVSDAIDPPPLQRYLYVAVIAVVVLAVAAFFASLRLIGRANVGVLAAGFDNIYSQKHPAGLST
jgi:hypothetical protein